MKTNITKIHHSLALQFLFSLVFANYLSGQSAYESYYLRSANYPVNADLGDREIQGVTHDQDNWFFTWTNKEPNNGYLSKIPLGIDLADCVLGAITPCPQYPSQIIRNMEQVDQLMPDYWHWGDPDHYQYEGTDYIVVPIRGESSPPIVAIFRAFDLSLAFIGDLTQQTSSYCDSTYAAQRSVGWCAIHPQTGDLFTSEDYDYTNCIPGNCDDQGQILRYPRQLLHYKIPWDTIPPSGYVGRKTLQSVGTPQLLRGVNGEFIELYNMQGGEFTPSGELLYISCGSACCVGKGVGQVYRSDGIYVFKVYDAESWRSIKRSSNHYYNNNHGYFDYYYRLGCDDCWDCWGGSWSPEGLTFWDLDNGQDPTLDGQLHVLLFHCQVAPFTISCSDNEVGFEHFGGRLYVDPVNGVDRPVPTSLGNDPLPGGPLLPFKTFQYAYDSYPSWDGCEIVIKAGSYPAIGSYSTRVRLVSQDGSAILGSSGVQLFQDLNYTGYSCFIEVNCPNLGIPSISFDNRISSLKLFNLSGVRLYTDPNYTGNSIQVTGNVPNLEICPGINDEVSSVKLIFDK